MLNGYIGQKDRLSALKATLSAHKNGRPLPHMLFLGNSGLGKTKLAEEVANEIGKQVIVCHAPSVIDKAFLTDKIIEAEGNVLFIDEIHALNRMLAEDLYSVIDKSVVHIEQDLVSATYKTIFALHRGQIPATMEWHGPDSYRIPVRTKKIGTTLDERALTSITIIGATTDEALLPPAFLSRLSSLKIYLRPYTVVELGTIVVLFAESIGLTIDRKAAIYLAQRSRSTPRRAKQLLERAADFAAPATRITEDAAITAVEALGIDDLGLEQPHREILKVLADGPLSRTSLGQRLGLPAANLSLYWGDLLAQGLVTVSTRHEITQKGLAAIL
jgi:Holliday junction DNA helicase RuvB